MPMLYLIQPQRHGGEKNTTTYWTLVAGLAILVFIAIIALVLAATTTI